LKAADSAAVVRIADRAYQWIEPWAQLPDGEARGRWWPHTALVCAQSDQLLTFDHAQRSLISLDVQGHVVSAAPVEIDEAHGIALVVENGVPAVWLADASVGKRAEAGYARREDVAPRVIKVGLDGGLNMSLERPPHPAYSAGDYRPTSVAVFEERFGGNGDIWVGDGYGESYVHHYDRRGNYLESLSGEEGGGRFKEPHHVFIDRRGGEPELYVGDRANGRIQVYGLDGRFRRVVQGFLSRPTWFAAEGEFLWVVEYHPPRLTLLDSEDRLVGFLAEGPPILDRPGWPNELDPSGERRRPSLVSGKLNSPHSMAIDAEGNLYVTEYLIGGRLIKLARTPRVNA
jgi:hypothetical protein